MQLTKMTMSLALFIFSSTILTAPLPQGAGVGAGCDAILTDADTSSRLAVKEAGQNAASLLKSAGAKRQGAGVGDACNAILTDGDTGSGLAVKEAGQNAASLLKSAGARRQLDKAGAGTAAVIGVVDPELADYQEGLTNNIDGDGTSDSTVIGEQVGALEAEAGEGAGNLVPSKLLTGKRQLDKAGAGTAAIISIVNPDVAEYQEGLTNNIDGDGTNDSAVIGEQAGALEAEAGEGAGSLVPSKLPTTGA
ncbi:uncharacterized protein PAC_07815 [Phialocephala subalpina]|uniref:Uncharacterized protein n=1 Tax=Phialocephala subalpina TaxID=576137 RepID=A0A1L7WYS3_9HELO|nr:uncharacterized protein PAC_07815 [Phialocephala subalpina]